MTSTRRNAVTPFSGKGICRWCGEAVPKGRRSWCSDDCVQEYQLRADPAAMRRFVLERDKGICALCRFDCVEAESRFDALRNAARDGALTPYRRHPWPGDPGFARAEWYRKHRIARATKSLKLYAAALRAFGFSGVSETWFTYHGRRSLWDADHILPVCEGGGETGPENIRTLCQPCHKAETKKLARRRAERRRPQLVLPLAEASP